MWHSLFIKPILNSLVIIYNILPYKDMGLAVIILTLIIKLAFFPFQHKSSLSQIKMSALAPKIKEIKEKHKGDMAKQAEEMNKLYKEHKINPFSGIIIMIVQFVIIIALYRVFFDFSKLDLSKELYSFVKNPGDINFVFLGFLDITKKSVILGVFAGIFQYIQSKLSLRTQPKNQSKAGNFMAGFQKQLVYIGPLFSLMIVASLPSVVGLYWITMTIVGIFQQIYLEKALKKPEHQIKI